MTARLCLFCQHFWLDWGCEAWSDATPGDAPSVGCKKEKLTVCEVGNLSLSEYRRMLLTAESCDLFEVDEEAKP